jgi:hypothetical protein
MMSRKLFPVFAVALTFLFAAGYAFSLGMDEDVRGIVTGIDPGEIKIKDFMGVERTIELKNPDALAEFRIGDRAEVKDGILLPKEGVTVTVPPSPGPR